MGGAGTAPGSDHADGRVQGQPASGAALQLRDGAFRRAGLAEDLAVALGHLVAADDDCAPGGVGDLSRPSAGPGASARSPRGLPGQRRFVDVGHHDLEGGQQPGQQFAPVAGTGAQDDGGGASTRVDDRSVGALMRA